MNWKCNLALVYAKAYTFEKLNAKLRIICVMAKPVPTFYIYFRIGAHLRFLHSFKTQKTLKTTFFWL